MEVSKTEESKESSAETLSEMSEKFNAEAAKQLIESKKQTISRENEARQKSASEEATLRLKAFFEQKQQKNEPEQAQEKTGQPQKNEPTQKPNSFLSSVKGFFGRFRTAKNEQAGQEGTQDTLQDSEPISPALSEESELSSSAIDEEAEKERAKLEEDMATARNMLERQKHERFRNQRAQELLERNLNDRLLSINSLEDEIIMENPGVEKRSISYDGVEIPVYDLKGLPFSLLTHTVDYRRLNKKGDIGTETYKEVMESPSIWMQRKDEAEQSKEYGTRKSSARGDTISTSYRNSEKNLSTYLSGDLVYGFATVEPDSVLKVINNDGRTPNIVGKAETSVSNAQGIDALENNFSSKYNEILLRRYTENGMPKKPDYIVSTNGQFSEAALRHAKYYGIPIINIEEKTYLEKAAEKGKKIIDSIDENGDYLDIVDKITELRRLPGLNSYIAGDFVGIGRDADDKIKNAASNLDELQRKCLELKKIEQLKRIEFIKESLSEAIQQIEHSTLEGRTSDIIPSPFDSFDVTVKNIEDGIVSDVHEDKSDTSLRVPGNYSYINIIFKLKGSDKTVETYLYNGKNPYDLEKALRQLSLSEEQYENSSSEHYLAMLPIVRRYFDACRKNEELE